MRELRQTVLDLRSTMFDLRDSTNSLLFRASQTNLDPLRYSHFDVMRQSSDNLHSSHHFSNNTLGISSFLLHDNLEKHTAEANKISNSSSNGLHPRSTFQRRNQDHIIEKEEDEEFDDQKTNTSKVSVNATDSSTVLNATYEDSVINGGGGEDGMVERISKLKQDGDDDDQAPEFVGPAQEDDEFGEVREHLEIRFSFFFVAL